MGPFIKNEIFRYSPLVSGGNRTSRSGTATSYSLSRILAVILALSFAAIAGFFAGRISSTARVKSDVNCELSCILEWRRNTPY